MNNAECIMKFVILNIPFIKNINIVSGSLEFACLPVATGRGQGDTLV